MAKVSVMSKDRVEKAKQLGELLESASTNIIKADPWVPFRFKPGAEELELELSYGAVKKVFRATGLNINKGEVKTEHLNDPDTIAQILAAGLMLSVEDVESRMNMRYMAYYAYVVSQAMSAVQPDMSEVTRILGELNAPEAEEVGDTDSPLQIVDPPVLN